MLYFPWLSLFFLVAQYITNSMYTSIIYWKHLSSPKTRLHYVLHEQFTPWLNTFHTCHSEDDVLDQWNQCTCPPLIQHQSPCNRRTHTPLRESPLSMHAGVLEQFVRACSSDCTENRWRMKPFWFSELCSKELRDPESHVQNEGKSTITTRLNSAVGIRGGG